MARKKISAYTLLEMIIIIGVFSALALIFLPVGIEQIQASKIENVVKDVQSLIYSQSQSAYTYKANKNYGIAFYSDHYIVFSGDSLSQADSQTRYDLSSEIKINHINFNDSGVELHFAKGTFRPHTFGSFEVSTSYSSYQITINTEGLVLVNKL